MFKKYLKKKVQKQKKQNSVRKYIQKKMTSVFKNHAKTLIQNLMDLYYNG